ncbi:hypothetical protein V5O48_010687 [Marasmius crinis-equi]|uniref:Malate dehydrogenase n=1 Tax=Marasmius crinis-equi TaxID=585013 RepID=A0ABR3F7P8_9AGAR
MSKFSLWFLAISALASSALRIGSCDVSNVEVQAGSLPAQEHPTSYIGLGVGTQNYTCSSSGTLTTSGALATVFDISCTQGTGSQSIAKIAYDLWTLESKSTSASSALKDIQGSLVLGQHYFVLNPTNATAGINPEWDFTAHFADSNAFVIATKVNNTTAPEDPTTNVDWLKLKGMDGQGSLANEIYRTDTNGGQPPASCEPGSDPVTVKYTAIYWFTEEQA